MRPTLLVVALVCLLCGLSLFAYQVALAPIGVRPALGIRGVKRGSALALPVFRILEPVLRLLAGWLGRVPLGGIRHRLRLQLRAAGEPAGLSPDELIAACGLCGAAACCALLGAWGLVPSPSFVVLPAMLGAALPLLWLRSAVRRRARRIERQLPSAAELAALCMGAGLDFPGSLAQITGTSVALSDPLVEEFEQVLQEIRLGHTRKSALRRLTDRVPSDAILQFCNSVIQAEEKGTPIARALLIQAQTLRLRRSIAAEERASGAALRLIGPMALVFLSVILLVVAPLVARFGAGEFRVL